MREPLEVTRAEYQEHELARPSDWKARQRLEDRKAAYRQKLGRTEAIQTVSDVGETPSKAVGFAGSLGKSVIKGLGLIKGMKGIKTEDQMIKNKELYFMGGGLNPALTPLGRPYSRDNPMELYFGRRQRGAPEGANTIFVSLQQGYEIDQLEVITGMTPEQIGRSLQYLRSKNLIDDEGNPT